MAKPGYILFDSLFSCWAGRENLYAIKNVFTNSMRKQEHPLHKYWNLRSDPTGDKVDDMALLLNEVLSQSEED